MGLIITGQHMETGDALQHYVAEELDRTITHHFDIHVIQQKVIFVKEGHFFASEIILHDASDHLIVRSHARSDDAYAAFDSALARIRKQLRRYKDRLHRLHRRVHHEKQPIDTWHDATHYTIDASQSTVTSTEHDPDPPMIIAEKTARMEISTVAEAVMRMEMLQLPALLFVHSKTGRINLVYHRDDGNIAWVDPCAAP